MNKLQGVDLSCSRDDRILFNALDFELNNSEVLLLEGKNGSGKTTLLRILCGFREPDTGDILWNGESFADSSYYADMAYVGHLEGIKKELTVLENLKMALALSENGRYSIAESLSKVHLSGYEYALVQTLSAGQKRRLSLARLLATKSVLWILDEPFTSLDRQGIKLIESLMIEHCQNGGMIVLTSHHDIHLPSISVKSIQLS